MVFVDEARKSPPAPPLRDNVLWDEAASSGPPPDRPSLAVLRPQPPEPPGRQHTYSLNTLLLHFYYHDEWISNQSQRTLPVQLSNRRFFRVSLGRSPSSRSTHHVSICLLTTIVYTYCTRWSTASAALQQQQQQQQQYLNMQ